MLNISAQDARSLQSTIDRIKDEAHELATRKDTYTAACRRTRKDMRYKVNTLRHIKFTLGMLGILDSFTNLDNVSAQW